MVDDDDETPEEPTATEPADIDGDGEADVLIDPNERPFEVDVDGDGRTDGIGQNVDTNGDGFFDG